jgi:hypothetical protein
VTLDANYIDLALDEEQLAALYSEFADEDRNLAEESMTDYVEDLMKEDVR